MLPALYIKGCWRRFESTVGAVWGELSSRAAEEGGRAEFTLLKLSVQQST